MVNLYILEPKVVFYLLCNAIIWFSPIIFIRGGLFSPSGILTYIFSASYWLPILIFSFSPEDLPLNIIDYEIETVAIASLYAGLGYVSAILLFSLGSKNHRPANKSNQPSLVLRQLNRFMTPIIIIVHCAAFLLLCYCLFEAINMTDSMDRYTFYDKLPFWYFGLLWIISLMIGIPNLLYYGFYIKNRGHSKALSFLIFILLLFLVVMNGYDGGRRFAGIAIFLTFVGYIIFEFNDKNQTHRVSKRKVRLEVLVFIFLWVFILSFLSNARTGLIGWNMNVSELDKEEQIITLYNTFQSVVMPTTTLHVNSHMAAYVRLYGESGYSNYFVALGNTLFPEFIFGEYLFGEPMMLKMHRELNWRGQDFGLLAEALYSGGYLGAFIIHFLLGAIAATFYRYLSRGNIILGMFYLTFLVALLNSIRSDTMNFMKVWIYFGLLLATIGFFAERRIRLVSSHTSGKQDAVIKSRNT